VFVQFTLSRLNVLNEFFDKTSVIESQPLKHFGAFISVLHYLVKNENKKSKKESLLFQKIFAAQNTVGAVDI
jgi:hypothetical protein